MKIVLLLFAVCIANVHAAYKIQILLRRFDNGQGFLKNGTHCSPYWNTGEQCNIHLKITACYPTSTDCQSPIDLQMESPNSNAINFQSGTKYGSWQNPNDFTVTDENQVYQGFFLNVVATDSRGNEELVIDSYTHQFDNGLSPDNFQYYSNPRGLIEPTLFSIAWKVTGDIPTPPPPTTEPPSTPEPPSTTEGPSTSSGPSTSEEPSTTTTPVTAKDCDEVDDKSDGVHSILINGNVVQVYCQFGDSGALTMIQTRGEKNPSVDTFDRTLDAYSSLFGTPGKGYNFWLGLDNMHSFSSLGKQYSLFVEVCCNTASLQYTYSSFTIGAGPKYILNATSQGANANRGIDFFDMSNANGRDIGQPFRTYASYEKEDKDEADYCFIINNALDPTGINNTTQGTGGWWFGSCSESLNGEYYAASELDENCAIKTNNLSIKGAGIEFKTNNLDDVPLFTRISYTRARMAIFNGNVLPSFTSSFCTGN